MTGDQALAIWKHLNTVHSELHKALYCVDALWTLVSLQLEHKAPTACQYKEALANMDELEMNLIGGPNVTNRAQVIEDLLPSGMGDDLPDYLSEDETLVWKFIKDMMEKKFEPSKS